MKGSLILEDGSAFSGELLDKAHAFGEVVFNTGMTGYQEVLTDPSYCSQIVTLTYPLIGNYGVAKDFMQSRKAFVNGLIIAELCDVGSNWQSEGNFAYFLREQRVPCLYGVDTRAVTRHIRSAGAMKGIIVPTGTPQEEIDRLLAQPLTKDVVAMVTTKEMYTWDAENADAPHIVVMDFGVKQNILRSLHDFGFNLMVVPAHTSAEEILAQNPDGIFLSNGPGDPKDIPQSIAEVKKLIGKKPIFGICLGHQIFALAMGADTYKLKFGHHGSNQPVKHLAMNRVYISSQNHGFAVDEASLQGLPLEVTHRSINDGIVEGLRHTDLPIFTVQYHPEASPGPVDNRYLFQQFHTLVKEVK